jgi:hypothetical protein
MRKLLRFDQDQVSMVKKGEAGDSVQLTTDYRERRERNVE